MVLNRFERLDQFIYKTGGARLSVCLVLVLVATRSKA